MSLKDNPIFLTQKRLVHRGGVLAAILIATLVGLSFLSGLIAYIADPRNFPSIRSLSEAGKTFYAWTIAVEILVLIAGGFSRISSVLANERKAGLWDSNRLTPLKPWQLIIGYWFGSPLREFYMSVVLATTGLAIVLLAELPITLWLGTQILIFSTALLFGLMAILTGMVFQRSHGIVFLLAILFSYPYSIMLSGRTLLNFLLPTYGIVNLFQGDDVVADWSATPEIYGVPINPLLLTLLLQFVLGIFVWRAVVRRTANPFQPFLLRWEFIALFAILIISQHGLIWNLWHGHFPFVAPSGHVRYYQPDSLMPMVQGATLLCAVIILLFSSPSPEHVRIESMRLGIKNLAIVFSRSAVSLALALSAVIAIAVFTQVAGSFAHSWEIYLIAVGNFLTVALIFSLLVEVCRLRHKRRALGFVALWLFVVCVLPFILAGVFVNGGIARFSLLAPGCIAFSDPHDDSLDCLLGIVFGHFLIAVLLFIGWQREWKKLLTRAA